MGIDLLRLLQAMRSIVGRRHHTAGHGAERRGEDRRRAPRLVLESAGAKPVVCVEVRGLRLPLRDLSLTGFCVFVSDSLDPFGDVGAVLDVVTVVGETCCHMRVRVANRRLDSVGCEIVSADPLWHATASKILDPISIGQQLREIDPRFVEPDKNGNRVRWFQSGPTCDLFLWWRPEGQFLLAQLFFMGMVAEWSPQRGVRTGRLDPESARQAQRYARSETFHLSSPPDTEILVVARRILRAAELPPDVSRLLP